MAKKAVSLPLSGDEAADAMLVDDPLALLIGMVLDQQIPLEKAFRGPFDLRERMKGKGVLDAGKIATMAPDKLVALFAERPALHRFPASMARRVQEMCQAVAEEYGGDAAAVWTGAKTGAELLARVKALPGFGEQKARIFVALLGKRLGVKPKGWQEAAGSYADTGSFASVADIDSPEALARVRAYKRTMKEEAKAKAAAAPA
ncbi:MAG TPA: HhH-GPD-type base excision DNA repair protein [Acidimicrobiales bacterium]|nr:HhH-GPD-type base excision DNA repair protein [Acidimicrobiales bacterium]